MDQALAGRAKCVGIIGGGDPAAGSGEWVSRCHAEKFATEFKRQMKDERREMKDRSISFHP
jgi:hypothetical protein